MSGEMNSPFDDFKVLGTENLFTIKPTSLVNYPYTGEKGPYTVLGPVLLPQIYGKDLNTIEIGSSGTISLSIYDSNVMTINETSNISHTPGSSFNIVSFNSTRDDDALQLNSGSNIKKVLLDHLMVSESNISGSNWNVLSTDLTGIRIDGPFELNGEISFRNDLSISGVANFERNVFIEGPILKIPVGGSDIRPDSNADNKGYIFFNTELNQFEGVNNQGDWVGFGGVIDLDKDTFIVAEVDRNNDDTLRFHAGDSNNARMTVGSSLMDVNIAANFNNTFTVEGLTLMKSNVEIYEQLIVGNQTFMRNILSVSGVTTLENNLSVGGGVTMNNTLDVVNVSTFNSNVHIIGTVTMANTLRVSGEVNVTNNAEIEGDFSVQGETTLTGQTTINHNTIINSNVVIRDNLNIGKTAIMETTITRGTLSVGSSAIIEGTTELNSNLIVSGPTLLQSTLEVNADVSLANALSVSGDILTNATLITNTITPLNGGNDISINLGPNNAGTLTVNGNLDIMGSFNNINVTTSTLQVEDKVITLASGSNDVPDGQQYINVDGVLNNKSGFKIEGIMEGFNSNSSDLFDNAFVGNVFEKSFLWNWTEDPSSIIGGMQNGPLSTIDAIKSYYGENLANKPSIQLKTESFWELKGGALRISSVIENSTGELEKISYSIRITNNKELQFVKHEYDSTGVLKTINQVASFGVSF